ncbi:MULTISPECIES: TonB-dependent siderophore receptor [unclassified Marinobacterium]|uniref:TonB-dependent receptor plug domain-containing protein n=1 Tax=unclassified Marinobacterium TaxID=2644139 RepID=UPI00156A187A|nr:MULTISPECIES: TonB-dependent receptor [unclassified Marinobacterium]NRP09491.1 Vitamin B12 transporter BtuB precursor [Marinobacterium sp. xm-g-48]NRP58675.1 Vitamin B12 transporter BtuB precursor [Marinobacterium sp. xm-d-564]NRP81978.1 Vitamin B12 transporter BtuB precursor [Marinobacterium sp. xm-d-509]
MKLFTTLLLAASTASSFAIAESIDPLKVTVTAKRITSSIATTPQAISILTSEELESGQFSSLSEALESMAGVYIQRFGGNGSQAKVYLRGTSSNHSIVLMDGRRLTSTNDGRAELENIPLDSIERIEVVRGGLSSKYGADAIGGVIQIFTKDFGAETNSNKVSITAGSQNTLKEKIELKRGDDSFESKIVIAHEKSDGFDTHTSIIRGDNDDDGYKKQNVDVYLSKSLSNTTTVNLDTGFWKGTNQYDYIDFDNPTWNIKYNNETEYTTKYLSLGFKHTTSQFSVDSKLSRTENERLNKPADTRKTIIDTNEWNTSVNYSLSDTTNLHGGIDLRREYGSSTYGSGDYITKGFYLGAEHTIDDLVIEGTVRHENHDQWGTNNTWSTGFNYNLNEMASIFGSMKTAFSAPTFSDLDPVYGNTDLKPEEVKSTEVGVRNLINSSFTSEIVFFKNDFKNLIQYSSGGMKNVAKATSEGTEISLKQRWASADLSASYSFTQTKDANGNQLDERPMDNFVLSYNQDIASDFSINSSLNWINRLKTYGSNGHLPASTTINLGLIKNYTDSMKVSLKVDNVLDEDYQVAYDYNGRGRYFEATLTYSF